jgi:hypothetical protein
LASAAPFGRSRLDMLLALIANYAEPATSVPFVRSHDADDSWLLALADHVVRVRMIDDRYQLLEWMGPSETAFNQLERCPIAASTGLRGFSVEPLQPCLVVKGGARSFLVKAPNVMVPLACYRGRDRSALVAHPASPFVAFHRPDGNHHSLWIFRGDACIARRRVPLPPRCSYGVWEVGPGEYIFLDTNRRGNAWTIYRAKLSKELQKLEPYCPHHEHLAWPVMSFSHPNCKHLYAPIHVLDPPQICGLWRGSLVFVHTDAGTAHQFAIVLRFHSTTYEMIAFPISSYDQNRTLNQKRTLNLRPCLSLATGADFDGDEMNLYLNFGTRQVCIVVHDRLLYGRVTRHTVPLTNPLGSREFFHEFALPPGGLPNTIRAPASPDQPCSCPRQPR